MNLELIVLSYLQPLVPLGAITIIGLVFIRIPEHTTKPKAVTLLPKLHHYLDLVGFALFAPAVLQLLLALQFGGNKYSWGSSRIIGLFCGSFATFVVWLYWNYRQGDNALLPISMISKRVVWTGGLYYGFLMSAVYGATYFLPIYFQAILHVNALLSGVYLFPTILTQIFMAGLSGPLLMKIGYVIPLSIVSTTLLTIGNGLYSLLQPGSSTGKWVGFQLLAGIGSGTGMQMAIIAVQAAISETELPSAMSFLIFAQSLGPAITLAICNLIFDESLKSQLSDHQVDATAIIDAGATGFRAIVAPNELHGVLVAYANSIDHVFYFVAAVAAMGAIVLWGMGWQDLRPKREEKEEKTVQS